MSKSKQIILNKILKVVNNTATDSEVYLYSSRARGTAKKLSDWDLLILLNLKQILFDFKIKFMDKFHEIEVETGEIISPLIYTKTDWTKKHSFTPLFENIQKEGIRIK